MFCFVKHLVIFQIKASFSFCSKKKIEHHYSRKLLNLAYIKLEAGNSSFNNHTSNTSYVESMQIEPDQLFNNEENSNKSHNSSKQSVFIIFYAIQHIFYLKFKLNLD